jgi:hypothetical protein
LKTLTLLFFSLLAAPLLRAEVALSTLYGEDLLGKPFTLEARAAGKTTVVILGFSKEAGKPCQAFEDAFLERAEGFPWNINSTLAASIRWPARHHKFRA